MFLFFLIFTIIGFLEIKKYNINKILYILTIFLSLFLYEINPIIFVIVPLLISQCFIDFKAKELSNINNLLLFIFTLSYSIYNSSVNWLSIIIMIGIYLILYLLPITSLGFGDVKLIAAISCMIPTIYISSFIFYPFLFGLILGLFYKLILKQNTFPMGPPIILTFLIFAL